MELNQITEKIIGCAIEVHKCLGPGLLESAYEECLSYELKNILDWKLTGKLLFLLYIKI